MFNVQSVLAPLVDLLHDVTEGAPRWLTVRVASPHVSAVVRAATATAEASGYLPVALEDYRRVTEVPPGIDERAVMLIATPGSQASRRRQALMDAAARSSRPHILLSVEAPTTAPLVAREARAVYGPSRGEVPADVVKHLLRAERCADLLRKGSHAAAERLLRDVLGAVTRRRAWPSAVTVGCSLGRLLLERGRAADAAGVFGEAAQHAEAAEAEREAVLMRLWQATARVDAGLLVAAEAQCRAAMVWGTADRDIYERAAATLARVLLWQGHPAQAAEVAAGVSGNQRGDPYAVSVWVRVAIAGGEHFQAGLLAARLRAMAADTTDPVIHVMAVTTALRLQVAMGDLAAAEDSARAIRSLTRAARMPLRWVRARLIGAEALQRAGREPSLSRDLRWLRRMRGACPPLLRQGIDARLRGDAPSSAQRTMAVSPVADMLSIVRDEEDDRRAVERLLESASRMLRCARVDVHSADAGPATVVASCGHGQVSPLGRRVLDAGVAIGPEGSDHAVEIAVPVRLGASLVAALAARWPADRRPPTEARHVLESAAAIAAARIESMLSSAREQSRASVLVPELVGSSAAMTELRKAIARAANAPFAVMIHGESGVGKELAARAIHQLGPRRQRRFCDVNCAAIPDELFESELFGHSRGAFTGAVADRPGLFEEAHGGTLFLDEVADLSARAQAKLLRVVQQQDVRRVGESFGRPVDVRIVAAANRDLRAETESGRFRQDLLYRLDVLRLVIPPLRERPDDVAQLAAFFWQSAAARVGTAAALSHALVAALAAYHWPGNVRELMNVMAALAVAAPARGTVRPHLLPAAIAGATQIRSGRLDDARQQFDRRFVEAALARAGGNRTRAARELGVSRQGLLKIVGRVGAAGTGGRG